MTEKRVKANERQKKSIRTVMKDLFNYTCPSEDDDAMMNDFIKRSDRLMNDLKSLEKDYSHQPAYPGRKIVIQGKKLLLDVIDCKYPAEFFNTVDSLQDDLLDFAEDYEPVKKFFAGEQKDIWDKSISLMKMYDESKTYIVDTEVEAVVSGIKAILRKDNPFSDIYKLPDLNERFIKIYTKLVRAERQPATAAIDEARARVFDELNKTHCKDRFSTKVINAFDELYDKANRCNNVATMKNIRHEADALKMRLLNEIEAAENKILEAQAAKAAVSTENETQTAPKPKKRKPP